MEPSRITMFWLTLVARLDSSPRASVAANEIALHALRRKAAQLNDPLPRLAVSHFRRICWLLAYQCWKVFVSPARYVGSLHINTMSFSKLANVRSRIRICL